MLVLTRKAGERIRIGDDIVVTVVEVRGDSIRIGIDAPRSVKVQRGELIDAVSQANTAAASPADTEALLRAALGAPRPAARPEGGESSR